MKHNSIALGFAAVALLIASCEPYEFQMADRSHPVAGLILSPLSTVEPNNRMTKVGDGGSIQLSNFGITEYNITTGLQLLSGTGMEVLIHPRVEVNRVVDSGVIARVTTHGSSLRTNNVLLADRPEIAVDTSKPIALKILSEGHLLQVIVGCDTLYRGKNYHIESDDIVIRTLPGSSVEVISPDWAYVPGLVRR